MRYLYNILTYLAVPFILLRLWWRGRKASDYHRRWRERFAYMPVPKEWQHGLWVHAVSVGEVLASVPLVRAIRQHYPLLPIIITTMTPTGSARVQANFGDSVFHCYVPYDIPSVVHRFLNRIQPRAVMILETELWPNIFHQCAAHKIPLMLANARLSEKSFLGYRRLGKVTRDMLAAVTILAAHAREDAQRFIQLGMDPARVTVTGSIKFEIHVAASILEQGASLRNSLGKNRPVWIAASTHEGEEEQLLAAHRQIVQKSSGALLIIAPRHPERFPVVMDLIKKHGFTAVTRSSGQGCTDKTQVYLSDTMGELMSFFAAVDLAFVGGSLIERGGHNLLEPAAVGLASLTGPSTFNFTEITQLLLAANATRIVHNSDELAQQVLTLLADSSTRTEMGERGRRVIEANRGALASHLSLLEEFDLDSE